jgi:shikimate kinase
MKNRIVTISRQFGSGGRTVGKQLAERLGIACYDSELIEKLAEQSGFAKEYVEQKKRVCFAQQLVYQRPVVGKFGLLRLEPRLSVDGSA